MRTIVIGYHSSEASKRALERVAGIADSGDSVTVVSAVPVYLPVKGQTKPHAPWEVEEHGRQLEGAKAIVSARRIEAESAEGVGEAADFIVAHAKEVGAELIVGSSHRKNVAERLALGSVSTKIVHHEPGDVLVVR